jgi:fatty acid desaturase
MISASPPPEVRAQLPGAPDLRNIAHTSLGTWLNFRETLRPRYWLAWCEVALCMSMILWGFTVHLILSRRFGNALGFETAIPFALWIGFWLHAILSFGHEAAHYNLSASKKRNDILADWTIWLFFPQTTKQYRKSHWQHHLHLGDPLDTEVSYHNCLSPSFLVKAITGIYLAELIVRYVFPGEFRAQVFHDTQIESRSRSQAKSATPLLRALTAHSIFVAIALSLSCYATAGAWVVAAVLIFPFCTTVRQVLEHRALAASCLTDFRSVTHGPVNRVFGSGLFAHFYGAAGFNRHLLHHWDPTISYTRFEEMKDFFDGTYLGPELRSAQSTYLSSFLSLLRQSFRG